jgi:hypothetical protein
MVMIAPKAVKISPPVQLEGGRNGRHPGLIVKRTPLH